MLPAQMKKSATVLRAKRPWSPKSSTLFSTSRRPGEAERGTPLRRSRQGQGRGKGYAANGRAAQLAGSAHFHPSRECPCLTAPLLGSCAARTRGMSAEQGCIPSVLRYKSCLVCSRRNRGTPTSQALVSLFPLCRHGFKHLQSFSCSPSRKGLGVGPGSFRFMQSEAFTKLVVNIPVSKDRRNAAEGVLLASNSCLYSFLGRMCDSPCWTKVLHKPCLSMGDTSKLPRCERWRCPLITNSCMTCC